ncbi:uncharacterized protein LDX57_003611 [Aspergillus melleus]|uniref:uncharacterized protein n=1 Tax=Aspergillus melleus TaxID=138277 RepID=UPI001E8DAB98|nr:uncharacterized protein LDX57_003611 [Aspergillus melleus]KAH8425872.1 hypothetical protein LDX57_003611 [Aspergillus melleus]
MAHKLTPYARLVCIPDVHKYGGLHIGPIQYMLTPFVWTYTRKSLISAILSNFLRDNGKATQTVSGDGDETGPRKSKNIKC